MTGHDADSEQLTPGVMVDRHGESLKRYGNGDKNTTELAMAILAYYGEEQP